MDNKNIKYLIKKNIHNKKNVITSEDTILESYIRNVCEKIDMGLISESNLDEGLKDMTFASIFALIMAIPGFVEAAELEKDINGLHKRPDIIAALDVYDESISKDISGYSFAQAVDILARTIYSEAADQGYDGQLAIMSVIWNRAGGKIENIIPVVFKPSQFCGWNKANPSMTSGKYSPANYDYWIPSSILDRGPNPKNKIPLEKSKISYPALKVWNDCKEIAADVLMNEKFDSTIGRCNMIINPKKDNASFLKTWEDRAEYTLKDHKFAYDPTQDGFKTSNPYDYKAGGSGKYSETMEYTVSDISKDKSIIHILQRLIKNGTITYEDNAYNVYNDVKKLNPNLKYFKNDTPIIKKGTILIIPTK